MARGRVVATPLVVGTEREYRERSVVVPWLLACIESQATTLGQFGTLRRCFVLTTHAFYCILVGYGEVKNGARRMGVHFDYHDVENEQSGMN